MNKKCIGCGSTLQTENELEEGYIKQSVYEKALYCERCFKITHYGESSIIEKEVNITNFINTLNKSASVIYLLDITCISNKTLSPLQNIKNDIYLCLTKRDLLPKSVKDKKLIDNLKLNYKNIKKIFTISNKKMWNIDSLYNALTNDKAKDIYVLGYTNSGKSSLINCFLKKEGETPRITTSIVPNTTTQTINIKFNENLNIIDTPGFINENSIVNFISINKYKTLLPKKEIKPKIYNLKPQYTIIIEDFIRIENNSDKIINLVFYLKNDLKYQKMKITTSSLLKNYDKSDIIIEENKDLIIEGLGFIKFPKKAELTIYTVNKKIISKRNKLI